MSGLMWPKVVSPRQRGNREGGQNSFGRNHLTELVLYSTVIRVTVRRDVGQSLYAKLVKVGLAKDLSSNPELDRCSKCT